MIFYQYEETCELLLDDPNIGGEDAKDFVKRDIINIMYADIDVYRIRLIAGLPGDGVKYILKLQTNCANMTFSEKSRYDRILQQVTHKGGESEMNYIKIFQNSQALSVSLGKIILRIS